MQLQAFMNVWLIPDNGLSPDQTRTIPISSGLKVCTRQLKR